MPTFSNIFRPFLASISAMSCGVVTMTAPVTGTCCASVSWMSPVPGGRSIDEVVEVLPVGLRQQLLQRLRDHRAAPHHRLVDVDQQADRAHLQAVVLHRLHRLAVHGLRLAGDAEHGRLARAVDVGVEHADPRALGGERQRQVGRHRALADAALARGDGDDVLHVRHHLQAALHRVRDDLHRHVGADVAGAGRLQRVDHRAADAVDLAGGRVAEFDVDADVAALDAHVARGARADEVLAGVGVDDALQRFIRLFDGDGHG